MDSDKFQFSSVPLRQNDVSALCPHTIECIYSANGREYQGTVKHLLVKTCHTHRINQKFTKLACLQTNEKAERVIRAFIKMEHNQQIFSNSKDQQRKLKRLINFYLSLFNLTFRVF
jgi:hypothetical protein